MAVSRAELSGPQTTTLKTNSLVMDDLIKGVRVGVATGPANTKAALGEATSRVMYARNDIPPEQAEDIVYTRLAEDRKEERKRELEKLTRRYHH
jgi:hypothetical protein